MNIIEKIIAEKAGVKKVQAGEEYSIQVDLAMAHDVTGPMAVEQFQRIGIDRVFDPDKVAFVIDHNIPSSTVDSRRQHHTIIDFAKKVGARLYSKGEGVIHQIAAEEGLYEKGDVVVGADSHTCTAGAYGAIAIPVGATEMAAVMALGKIDLQVPRAFSIEIEGALEPGVYAKDVVLHIVGRFGVNGFTDKAVIFTGDTIENMTTDDKMTISNMSIEMGAMISYIDQGDEIGPVEKKYKINASKIRPLAACPPSPAKVKYVKDLEGIPITQVVVGSCTNGRFSDMTEVVQVIKGRKIHENVTLIIVPASRKVLNQMEEKKITQVLRSAGAIIANPGCGPCFGAHQGLLSENDVALSTTNRNFPGRMGHKNADIFLVSPRTAAESAVKGCITSPGTVLPLEV